MCAAQPNHLQDIAAQANEPTKRHGCILIINNALGLMSTTSASEAHH